MKFHFRSALFVALLSLFMLTLASPTYSQTNGRISGIVVDASTGESLAGANVVILGTYLGVAADMDGYS